MKLLAFFRRRDDLDQEIAFEDAYREWCRGESRREYERALDFVMWLEDTANAITPDKEDANERSN